MNVYNIESLSLNDITSYYHKVRAIVFNDNSEIYVSYIDGSYNLPGGGVEENESINDAVIREIKEELGITISNKDLKYIDKFHFYHKNFPGITKTNRHNEVELFLINKKVKYNKNNIKLTDYEKSQNFEIKDVNINKIDELINEGCTNEYKKFMALELKVLLDEYIRRN